MNQLKRSRILAAVRRRPLLLICLALVAGILIRDCIGETRVGEERLSPRMERLLSEGEEADRESGGEVSAKVTGTVEAWQIREKSVQYVLRDCEVGIRDESCRLRRVRVTQRRSPENVASHYAVGSVVCARGKLSRIEEATNPGQFDARAYYRTQGISFRVFADRVELARGKRGAGESLALARAEMAEWQKAYLGEEEAGVLAAITLGERAMLTDENRADYRVAGIFHVICISGLHISMLGMLLFGALFRIGILAAAKTGARRERGVSVKGGTAQGIYFTVRERAVTGRLLLAVKIVAAATATAGMIAYVIFVGSPPSALRALVMFGVMLGAKLCGRSYDSVNALCLAAVLILAFRPAYLFHSGFQLSFIAVIGAGLLYPRVMRVLRARRLRRMQEDGRGPTGFLRKAGTKLWQGLLLWLCVTAVSLPLVARYYYEIPVWGFLANLVLVPLVGVVLISGLAGGAVCLLGAGAAGRILLLPASLLLRLFTLVSGAVRHLPGASWICGQPAWWQVAVYYAGLITLIALARKTAGRHTQTASSNGRQSTPEPRACLPPTQHCQSALCALPGRGLACTKRASLRRRGLIRRGAATRRQRVRGGRLCVAAGCFLLATLALFWRPQAGFSLAMLDVGQGDCLVLREGRHVFLVDGGSTNVSEVGKYRIIPYLKSQGISRIDGIFVTHGDEDHISGIRELLGDIAEGRCAIRVDALLLPRWMRTESAGLDAAAAGAGAAQTITERTDETDLAAAAGAGAAQTITERTDETDLAAAAAGAGAAVRYLQTGDEIAAGELAFRVLAPAAGGEALSGNEGSLVLHARRGTFDMLLTGDLEGAGEEAVLPLIEDTDLLKVAHHGSRNATTARFLLRAKPEICLVSAPDGGRYGHPHKETLERIAETGADCYITRDCGAITVRAAGDAVYIEP